MYIGGDANLTYDVMFGNADRSPYACVVCANMGSGSTCFVRYSLMEQIAIRTNLFSKYLLCIRGYGWEGYGMLKTVSNTRGDRYVWKKGHRNVTIDDLYEEIKKHI